MTQLLPPENPLNADQRRELLRLARQAITVAVNGEAFALPEVTDPRLLEPRGVFVTLYQDGNLRGCLGNFGEDLPLAAAVVQLAPAAALRDPRFPPVTPAEVDTLVISLSALTPLRVVDGPDDIVIGRDGVRVSQGGRSGTLLPQVAVENDWDVETFLTYTCRHKAHLPPDAWRQGAVIETYGADVFSEQDEQPAES